MTQPGGTPLDTLTRSVPFALVDSTDTEADGLTLRGYAAVFNSVTRIDSWEGRFDEQISPGAFAKTIRERVPVMQFDHGQHPLIGSLPIGSITDLREDPRGLYVEARLHDNWLTEPVRDAIASGSVDGMSFRFSVVPGKETWDKTGEIPLRTIKEVRCAELGPVVFPAYEDTSVSVRSLAAHLADELDDDDRAGLAEAFASMVKPEAHDTRQWSVPGLLMGAGGSTGNLSLIRVGSATTTAVPVVADTLADDTYRLRDAVLDEAEDPGLDDEARNALYSLVETLAEVEAFEYLTPAPNDIGTSAEAATRSTWVPKPPVTPEPSPDTRSYTREAATLRLLSLKGTRNAH